ncbi:MAG: hypothetical protein RIE73_38410 [Coleofasciculus sp. C1-SOL-03]
MRRECVGAGFIAEGRRQKAEGRRQKAEGRRLIIDTSPFQPFTMS